MVLGNEPLQNCSLACHLRARALWARHATPRASIYLKCKRSICDLDAWAHETSIITTNGVPIDGINLLGQRLVYVQLAPAVVHEIYTSQHKLRRVCSVPAKLQVVLKPKEQRRRLQVTMPPPRPVSASRAPAFMEQELLQKIGLLAEHHTRNVKALHRLRRSAWTAGDPVSRTGVSKDSMLFSTPPAEPRRTFTRVATAAESSWTREPTVVEPFRSMDTHATAWKRKMRKYEEVRSIYIHARHTPAGSCCLLL